MSNGMCYEDDVSNGECTEEVCRRGGWAVIVFGAAAILGLVLLPGRAYAEARVWADFNGDGYNDLAIGTAGIYGSEDIESKVDAGAVNVIYGSASGLTSTGNQFWSQDSPGILDDAEVGDSFGWSLTAGDFNGDGCGDLAIGVRDEDIGSIQDGGAVNVIYGSASGLTSTGNQFWNQNSANILDSVENVESFGWSLISGDYNGDKYDDLAIGVGESIRDIEGAGAVNVIYGSASGLTSTGNQFWNQDNTSILDSAEDFDLFGSSLTSGDYNGDKYDDLAIGVRDEDIEGIGGAGAVNIIYGSVSGLATKHDQFWHQNSPGISDVSEESDSFGELLTSGDYNGDGYDDLAIGVPLEDIGDISCFQSICTDAGAVNVIYGSANRLTSTGNQFWSQNTPSILDSAGDFDNFGSSLTSGDYNGDKYDDLAIGVPGETRGDIIHVINEGAVNVIYGSANRLTSTGNQFWSQNTPSILDSAEDFDLFGSSLAAGDFNGDGYNDLAIGVIFEDIGTITHAGAVNVIYGSAVGLTTKHDQFWSQNTPGILDSAETDDFFGSSLSN